MIKVAGVSTTLLLSCEAYTNKGATYEMFKEVIEGMRDPYFGYKNIDCERSGINGNPKITLTGPCPSQDHIGIILETIENGIQRRLEEQCSQ
jgi:hypothetical protein